MEIQSTRRTYLLIVIIALILHILLILLLLTHTIDYRDLYNLKAQPKPELIKQKELSQQQKSQPELENSLEDKLEKQKPLDLATMLARTGAPVVFKELEEDTPELENNLEKTLIKPETILEEKTQEHKLELPEEPPLEKLQEPEQKPEQEPELLEKHEPEQKQVITPLQLRPLPQSSLLLEKNKIAPKNITPKNISKKTGQPHTEKITIADITRGVMSTIVLPKHDSMTSIFVEGKDGVPPTAEQIKYTRYIEKIFACIQSSLIINSDKVQTQKAALSDMTVHMTFYHNKKIDQPRLIQSCGVPALDDFILFALWDARNSYPDLPDYIGKDRFEFPLKINRTILIPPLHARAWMLTLR